MIATHSPIVLAYPQAEIYECSQPSAHEVGYEDAGPVRHKKSFLEARER